MTHHVPRNSRVKMPGRLLAALLAGTPALAAAAPAALLTLSMEHFRDTASVTEDPASGASLISTQPGFTETAGPMKSVWHDDYLTAVIERDGARSFRIDVSLTYPGDRRSWPRADLAALGGPRAVTPILIRTTSTRCQVGDCIYTDYLQIPIEEAVLRRFAQSYAPGHATLSIFRLSAKSGVGYRGKISDAEAAGLLARVDGFTPGSGVAPAAAGPGPAAATVRAAAQPQRLDLGLSGLPVSASADDPHRAGVLVVEVKTGSVAQRTGIITGDIIEEVDGRPTRSLADLQAAIGVGSAQGAAAIKIFRGQKEMTLQTRF